jgi:NADH pyrophosphatase NudC (nudix superfamily)
MTTERKPHGYYTDKVFTPADVDKAIAAERKALVAQRTEQNFCPRCGKRTKDIHTCTPPKENA